MIHWPFSTVIAILLYAASAMVGIAASQTRYQHACLSARISFMLVCGAFFGRALELMARGSDVQSSELFLATVICARLVILQLPAICAKHCVRA